MSALERAALLGQKDEHTEMGLGEEAEPIAEVSETESEDAEFVPDAQTYTVEISRYFVLFALVLVNSSNAQLWMTYTAVVDPTEDYYGITSSELNTLNIVPPAIYVAMFWLSGAILPKTGLGWGLVIGATLNVLSTFTRLFTVWSVHSYGMIIASNVISGIAQCLILSAPPMLSNQWFALEERNFSTGVGVAAQIFGSALGVLLPADMVLNGTSDEWSRLYWVQFAFSAAGLVAALAVKKAPTLPPSAAAFKFDENVTRRSFHHERIPSANVSKAHLAHGQNDNHKPNPVSSGALSTKSTQSQGHKPSLYKYLRRAIKDILVTVKAIVTNKPYMLLLVVSGIGQGSIWTVGTLLLQIVQPFGVSQVTIGWIGFGGQIAGGMASIAVGGVLGKCKDFKLVLVCLVVATLVSVMLFPIVASIMGDDMSVMAANVLAVFLYIGLCVVGVPQCPILFELGVELTFPLSEEITSPLIMWPPSLFSLIFVILEGLILTQNPTRDDSLKVLYMNIGMFLLCAGAALLMKPKYNRREYELKHAAETAAATNPAKAQVNVINAV